MQERDATDSRHGMNYFQYQFRLTDARSGLIVWEKMLDSKMQGLYTPIDKPEPPPVDASTTVPLDDAAYLDLERLDSLGLLDGFLFGQRPLSRREIGRVAARGTPARLRVTKLVRGRALRRQDPSASRLVAHE